MSKLYFRYGAMNSGKSTHLMQVAHNYEERGMKVIIIKPNLDSKGGDRLVSRLGVDRKVDLLISEDDNIFDIIKVYLNENRKIDCILVDEVQFMKANQIDQLFEIAVKIDIPIICYGLRTDFKRDGFEGSTRLLLLAHSIEEMKTICACGKKAIFNGRKLNGKFVFEGEQIAIDEQNDVQYESLCGNCYYKYKEK
ncbi:thymidine kinase [Clostridium saccharobutylicum]|uniref:Thymidine kinase n=1 Tax=Clostridium saccharobutylicum DSM 13864 TaxID=1345695 RepID=U5MQ25_CLOSA|nr:thymidine kinase [Clostridium saccharobutylicum]AGX41522.1 thymidine kinase Tdk [Clostridium saccharobutylicum DSM 13864]AQR88802.1 thymidine kinase [Clostridium saccharobutylicum]AQR98701.1 thymidine kinase [Clostridium saccharobutylicum]AQS08423.1 thymidine kinase [Clostridium saccharobutylicum]AQS12691.1 thymidine kinase [Clostridium saccharobutylicum]